MAAPYAAAAALFPGPLTDGPCLGFVAERAGVADAPDITRFGGWRAWLQS